MSSDADPQSLAGLRRRSTLLQRQDSSISAQTSSGVLHNITNAAKFLGMNQGIQIGQNSGIVNFYHSNGVSSRETPPATVFDVPDLLPSHFVGRTKELEQIQQALHQPDDRGPARCIIYGMQGLGKSVVCLRYADSAFRTGRYSHVFWISARSTEKLRSGFSRILDLVAFPGRETLDQEARCISAKGWLEDRQPGKTRRWLLLLDNVSQSTWSDLWNLLPSSNDSGRLLFNCHTRSDAESLAMAHGKSYPVVGLELFSALESIQLLLHRSGKSVENVSEEYRKQAESIVKFLGNLPLAIDQAASLLPVMGNSLAKLANAYQSDEFEKVRRKILSITREANEQVLGWENKMSRYDESSIMSTVSSAIAELSVAPPGTIGLLKIMIFLDAECIPVQMLKDGYTLKSLPLPVPPEFELVEVQKVLESPITLIAAIQHLEKVSLVTKRTSEGATVLTIHDLVQRILQAKLLGESSVRKAWFIWATHIIYQAFETCFDLEDVQTWSPFIPHIKVLLDLGDKIDAVAVPLWDACTLMSLPLRNWGRFGEAERMLTQMITRQRDLCGPDVPETLGSVVCLVAVYQGQGRWKEAEVLGANILETAERDFEDDDDLALVARTSLAMTYLVQGRYAEAETLGAQAIDASKTIFPPDDPAVLNAMDNLASVYFLRGKMAEAEDLKRQVLERKIRAGEEHIDTLTCMSELSVLYSRLGRLADAMKLHLALQEKCERLFGDNHPLTLINRMQLAITYMRQKEFEKAQELERETLKRIKTFFGDEHYLTLLCMSMLLLIYLEKGRLSKATVYGEQTLKTTRRVLGEEHPATLNVGNTLAMVYLARGYLDQAKLLALQVVEARRKILGPEHPDTAQSMEMLASIHSRLENWREAESLQMQVVEARKKSLGASNPECKESMQFLASMYRKSGNQKEAEAIERQIAEVEANERAKKEAPPLLQTDFSSIYDDPATQSLASCLTSNLLSPSATISTFLAFLQNPVPSEDGDERHDDGFADP